MRCLAHPLLFCTLMLPMLTGCVTYRLSSETTSEEREMTIDRAYVSSRGDLILQGRLPQPDGRQRYMIVSAKAMSAAIEKRENRNKESLPKITLPFEIEHRYVTADRHDHTFAEYDPHVLADAVSPPIEFYVDGNRQELIHYDWQSTHAQIETTKGLLLGPLHFGRTGGQKIAFAAGLLPAVAIDVITSPMQLIAGVVIYIYYDKNYADF